VRQIIPFILSANTLTVMWLVGNKRTLGWTLALIGQTVWFLFIAVFEAWGLLPLAVGLTIVYARNLWNWHRITQIDAAALRHALTTEEGQ
jgi:hypothetical protein